MKYIRNVLAAVRRADRDFSLIDDGDRIAVGVSGGKDSISLLRALSVYGRFASKNFDVVPVYLDLGFGAADLSPLKDYCESLGMSLVVNDSTFVYDILKAHTKEGHHLPCSICSRMKKAAINNVAEAHHCNKVAFAHHNDDAVETLLMNMVHGGRVATFEPKMRLERAKITFIRPLIYCREADLKGLCEEENLPVLPSKCPANEHTEREWAKNALNDLYKTHPEARDNFRKMLINHEAFKLYFESLELESAEDHSYALKPIVSADEMRGTAIASKKKREGECDFLILHRHKKVGEISYRHETAHRVAIFNLDGPREALSMAIKELMTMVSRRVNPVTFVLYGAPKGLPESLGFSKGKEPGEKAARYNKRVIL